MARNYEVHIDGRPFVIGERPKLRVLPANWLMLYVDGPEAMALAASTLAREPDLRGLHAFGGDPDQLWEWFRQGFRFVQAAGGAVTDANGRLLAIHRLGRWDLPKGKVEPDEAIEAAALREVREECGLHSLELEGPLCLTWHVYERGGVQHLKRTDWFLMRGDAAEMLTAQTEEAIDAVRWLDAAGRAELRRDTYPSLIKVLNAWEAAQGHRA